MKKNAILIAGIMFVAGCATHQGGYGSASTESASGSYDARGNTIRNTETIDRTPQGEPTSPFAATTSSQYDSANFHADSSIRGGSNEARGLRNYGRTDYDTSTNPDSPWHADSSTRGGSNEARGLRNYGRTDYDTSTNPDNPWHADSSIRGGSNEAHNRSLRSHRVGSSSGGTMEDSSIQNSSIHGGSNGAGGIDQSNFQSEYRTDDTDMDMKSDLNVYRGSGKPGVIDSATASNWNPSDDLLPDGVATDQSRTAGTLSYDESNRSLDDMTANPDQPDKASEPTAVGSSGGYQSGSSQSSSSSSAERGNINSPNSSKELERDISGDYKLQSHADHSNVNSDQGAASDHRLGLSGTENDQNSSLGLSSALSSTASDSKRITSDEMNTEDVGGPGSSETGSSSSSTLSIGAATDHEVGVDSDHNCPDAVKSSESSGLKFENQNVGDAASSEHGYDSSPAELSSDKSAPESQVGITSESQNWLYSNNRAQGVGSTATGEFGVANSSESQRASMNDDQLAQQVKASLVKGSTGTFGVTQSEARNIKVTANNGTVTLKGSVASEQQKKMVGISANEVAGVKRVDNQLTITPNANPASRDLGSGRNLEEATSQFNGQVKE